VSAARPSRDRPIGLPPAPVDIAELHARRREANRKRRLARVDIGLGVAGALVLLILSPGLAVTGLIAAIVLLACVLLALRDRRTRRGARGNTARRQVRSSRAAGRTRGR